MPGSGADAAVPVEVKRRKTMKKQYDLQLFDGGEESGAPAAPAAEQKATAATGSQKAGGYSYEQAEEIASARAQKAERTALADYFRKQGMTEEQVTEAISDFKAKQKAAAPDIAALTKERDELQAKLAAQENEKLLRKLGVREEDLDYVTFKAAQKVDDKTSFEKAATAFLKENPRYTGSGMRVSTSAETNSSGAAQSPNEAINEMIRRRAGHA